MSGFKMTVRFDVHDHSTRAHRHVVAAALDHVRQAVMSGTATSGNIETPAAGSSPRAVIGSWEMDED
jgi:hypothetical protein